MGLFLDFVTFGAWDFPTSVLLNFLALGLRTLRVFCTCVLLDLNFQTLGLGTLGFSGFSTFCFFVFWTLCFLTTQIIKKHFLTIYAAITIFDF